MSAIELPDADPVDSVLSKLLYPELKRNVVRIQ
jgi:hypothetical protein